MFAMLVASLAFSAAAADADPLQPLQFLVGSCWSGEFAGGGGTDTHCFTPVYGGKFVRDTHVVKSSKPDYNGESIYGWDAAQKHLVFWYWSSSGVIEHGVVEPNPEGLDFTEHRLTEPKDVTYRTRWHRLGADRYESLNEQKTDGGWKTVWKIEYHRVAK